MNNRKSATMDTEKDERISARKASLSASTGSRSDAATGLKYILANLGVNLVALCCVGVAAYLAVNDKEGWGWFLFVAVIAAGSVTFKTTSKEDDE